MATDTLRGDCALSKRADETPQQHADRLLDAHRTIAEAAARAPSHDAPPLVDKIINRAALDRLEEGSLAVEYAYTLCHAIMDRLESLQKLHGKNGVHRNDNSKAHIDIAANLLSLQLDQLMEGKEAVEAGVIGWPMLDGHRL